MLRPTTNPYDDFDFSVFMKNNDIATFIGKNYEYYQKLWEKDSQKSKGNPRKIILAKHINALAMLVSAPAWFGYRKMHTTAASISALFCLATFLESWIKIPIPSPIFLVVQLFIGAQTKGIYFDHVVRFFDRNKNTDRKTLEQLMVQKGGVSTGASLLWAFGFFVAIAAIAFSGEYFFPEPGSTETLFFEKDF